MKTLVEYVKQQTIKFAYIRNSELWYACEDGFMFPVPVKDLDGAELKHTENGRTLMKWIRSYHKEMVDLDNFCEE